MKKLDDDLKEIDNFFTNHSFESQLDKNNDYRIKRKSAYKQFHAMLIWGLAADKFLEDNSASRIYFTESLSDLSHAFYMTLINLYKPSKSAMRSALENMIRVYLLEKNIEPESIKSVYDMFAIAKKAYSTDSMAIRLLNKLHNEYGELCKSVHSSGLDYLSLKVPFENIATIDEKNFLYTIDTLRKVSSILNQSTFWIWNHSLSLVGHTNEDMIRDALPKSIKREKSITAE